MKKYISDSNSLNDMTLAERMEYQRIQDRKVITQTFMKGASVELKTFRNKRKHPFVLENIQNN